jgi:hypothetical protein
VPAFAFRKLRQLGALLGNSNRLSPRIHQLIRPEFDCISEGLGRLLGKDLSGPSWFYAHARIASEGLKNRIAPRCREGIRWTMPVWKKSSRQSQQSGNTRGIGKKVPRASKNTVSGAATEQITAVSEDLKIILRPLESLVPYAKNPRTRSADQVAQIAASIKEFGLTNPILLDDKNGLIAGHGRLAAARLLGLKTVPCIELGHLSEAQKRAYIKSPTTSWR